VPAGASRRATPAGPGRARAGLAASALAAAIGALAACSPPEVHVHDRHGLSFPIVERFARSHPGTTLVLFDYHHDVLSSLDPVTSANWVGGLLERGAAARVLWVSGRDLLQPNRDSRIAWLERSLRGAPPSEAGAIAGRIELVDWADLEGRRLRGPIAVSLDLDILCHDPGDPPERFLDEIAAWMAETRPGLVTVALSAAYQRDPAEAWPWLERFARGYPGKGARWLLEAGGLEVEPEGAEESAAWAAWRSSPEIYGRYGAGFWPGAGLWTAAPEGTREALSRRGIRAGDREAETVLSGWSDPDRAALERDFPRARLEAVAAGAARALEAGWKGEELPSPGPSDRELGVALRIMNGGIDRGCLALWRGVGDPDEAAAYCAQRAAKDPRYAAVGPGEAEDLELELSVFGPWRGMSGPLDFRPGLDSLLLVDGEETTLLQASLAVERRYGKEAFLGRLARKAGLGEDGWKLPGLRFRKSTTIWHLTPLGAFGPEGGARAAQSQRNEKK
jgi:AMMECR1 domain-containing protein